MKFIKWIAVMLALCMVMAWLPTTLAQAEEISGTCGENLTWILTEDGVLAISGTGDMYDFSSDSIPWADYTDAIVHVEIENGVTTIGEYAFFSLENMTSISIPNSVTSIGRQAFSFCTNLPNATLPSGLTCISDGLFYQCSNLTYVDIPDSVTSILQLDAMLLYEDALNMAAADVNGDGWADAEDAMLILQFDAALIERFPV